MFGQGVEVQGRVEDGIGVQEQGHAALGGQVIEPDGQEGVGLEHLDGRFAAPPIEGRAVDEGIRDCWA